MNWYKWRDFFKIAKIVDHWYLACHVHNPRKTILVPSGLSPPFSGSFEHLQLDCIQLSLSMSCQYFLVIVCVFSGWIAASPCWKADALTVAKKLLENVFPAWGTPSTISRHLPHWTNHTSLNEKLENLLESSLSLPLNYQARLKKLLRSSNLKFLSLPKPLKFPVLRYCIWSCWQFTVTPLGKKMYHMR